MEVFITGGANGIGRAAAEQLAGKGHSVTVFDRDDEALGTLPEEIDRFEGDVYDEERVEEALDTGDFDVVVNCAGYYELGAIEDMDAETVEEHFRTNVFGLLNVTRNAVPRLRETSGRIVNVSSVAGRISVPFFGVYSATKYSVEAISDALRMELKDTGVDVVIVEPGPVETGFNRRARQKLEKYLPGSSYSEKYTEVLEEGGMDGVSPEKAGRKLVKAVESDRPRARYTVTWQAWLGPKAKAVTPAFLWDRLVEIMS